MILRFAVLAVALVVGAPAAALAQAGDPANDPRAPAPDETGDTGDDAPDDTRDGTVDDATDDALDDDPGGAEPAAPIETPAERPPELTPLIPDDGTGGVDAIDAATTLSPPPARLSSWTLAGRLLDSEEVVRGFLEPVMQEKEGWSDNDQREVVEFLRRMGYHSIIRNEQLEAGGVRAVLVLEPVTLVRRISIDIEASLLYRARQPIFADELKRRMSLRPGSPLPLDRKARTEELAREAERLAFYLRSDGFFDAKVDVREKSAGDFASEIEVDIVPGGAYFIGKLRVEGNTAIDSREILALFHHDRICIIGSLCLGTKRFSRQQLNRDVQKLVDTYQRRGYPGVRVRTDFDLRHSFHRDTHRVEFTIEIRERRKIDVVFEGNDPKDFPADDLFRVVTFAEEGSYDDVEVESSAEAIRRHYQHKGYFEANVTWERVRFGVFERIVFSIDEGPKLQVREVSFHGNESIPRERIEAPVKTQVYQRIIIGESGGYATSVQLAQDLQRIEAIYRAEGFTEVDARLEVSRDPELVGSAPALAAAIAGDVEASGLYVHFHIDEGPRVRVGRVDFEFSGPHALSGLELQRVTSLRMGEPFVMERATADGEAVRRFYFSRGYPRAEVETTTAPIEGKDEVLVTHRVSEHSPARIGKIALRGNFKTADWILLDELRLDEGEPLTVYTAELAQSNLRQSGLFSAVQIDYLGLENNRQDVVNVLVSVEERHDNLVEGDVGGGYSTDSKWFTEATARMQNLFGTGARFDARGTVGQELLLAEGKLALPRWIMRRLFRTSLLFEAAAGWRQEETERFGELTTSSGSVGITKEGRRGFFAGWLLSLRYDFRQRQRDVDFVRVAGNSDDIDQTKVTTRSSEIGPVLVIDKRRDLEGRRNPLTPARGFLVQGRAVFAEDFLLGTDRFVKLGVSGQLYVPLGSRVVVSNGVRYDHGIPLGGAVILPEVERYFAGGDTTVRGFEEDRLATEMISEGLPPLGELTRFRVLPAGGNIRFIHNLDVQLRVWDDPWFDFPIASAIYLDTGLVTNSLVGLEVGDLRHSLGVALARWITPFGSLSVEYAIPLDPELADNPRGRFHVNLGVLF